MSPAWTVRSLLAWMNADFSSLGLHTPRLDAELLIAHVLGCDRVRLYMDLDRPLSADELAQIRALVMRRRKREPVAYIRGEREFYLRSFEVNTDVLIPRPDTETLIGRALSLLPADHATRVLDLCTGSGAIGVTLAAERALCEVDATDLSPAALAVARRNAVRHGVEARVRFHEGDLFDALPERTGYDLIVSNPPYIATSEMTGLAPEIVDYEPRLALEAGEDGLLVLRRLCAQAGSWLAPGGALLFELGQGQAEPVLAWLSARPELVDVASHADLGGIARVVEGHRKPA